MKVLLQHFSRFLLFIVATWFASCQGDGTVEYEFRCGKQLAQAELSKYVEKRKPKYNFEELKLLGKISGIVFNENGRTKNYDVQFWNKDESSVVIQVFGLSNLAGMDRSACAVFNFQDYNFPKETILVFYGSEKNAPELKPSVGLRKP